MSISLLWEQSSQQNKRWQRQRHQNWEPRRELWHAVRCRGKCDRFAVVVVSVEQSSRPGLWLSWVSVGPGTRVSDQPNVWTGGLPRGWGKSRRVRRRESLVS